MSDATLTLEMYLASIVQEKQPELLKKAIAAVEAIMIRDVLQQYNGNQSKTATALGITRSMLRERIRRYGFEIKFAVQRGRPTTE